MDRTRRMADATTTAESDPHSIMALITEAGPAGRKRRVELAPR